MHSPASDGTLLNHTLLGLLLLACMMKIIAYPFFSPLCFSSISPAEPSGQGSDLSEAAQHQATGIPGFRGRISDVTAIQIITATNSLDKNPNFPPASCHVWCLFLSTLHLQQTELLLQPESGKNCSTAMDQEHTWP